MWSPALRMMGSGAGIPLDQSGGFGKTCTYAEPLRPAHTENGAKTRAGFARGWRHSYICASKHSMGHTTYMSLAPNTYTVHVD